VLALDVAGHVETLRAGERGDGVVAPDDTDLSGLGLVVGLGERLDGLLGSVTLS
jgi:hypothetical protein